MDNQTPNNELVQQTSLNTTTTNSDFTKNQVSQSPHVPPLVIILLLLTFQPVALYLMYREKRYHRWFAYLLWVYAVMQLILFVSQAIFIYPQLAVLYKNFSTPQPTINIYSSLLFLCVLSIVEIFAGILLFKKTKEPFSSYKVLLRIMIGVLVFGFLFAVLASLYSFIIPIYTVTKLINK